MLGGGALLVAVLTIGQSTGGFLRKAALLVPPRAIRRRRSEQLSDQPHRRGCTDHLGVERRPLATATARRLRIACSPAALAHRHAQYSARLPIACAEGWSTVQTWTGVRLSDLAAATGVTDPHSAMVISLEQSGAFRQATLAGNQLMHEDSLLTMQVNGVDRSLDHGYPARIIDPALPGVHNTKWVSSIEFI